MSQRAKQPDFEIASDLEKVAYLQKLETVHYNKDFKDNLQNLMSMGFLDFAKNLQLLQENHNNLEPVLGKLIPWGATINVLDTYQ